MIGLSILVVVLAILVSVSSQSAGAIQDLFAVVAPPNRRIATTTKLSQFTYRIQWYFRAAAVMEKYIAKSCVVCEPMKLDMSEKVSVMILEQDGRVIIGEKQVVPASNPACRVCLVKLLTGEDP